MIDMFITCQSYFPRLLGSDIIDGVDMLITPEARREVDALRLMRPAPSTWGVLIGHRRGRRFIVEKLLPAGAGRTVPDEALLSGLDGIWPGHVIGLFAIRPGAAFKKAVRGPAWYGKLVILLSLSSGAHAVRPFVVEFERKFSLVRIGLAPAGKARPRAR